MSKTGLSKTLGSGFLVILLLSLLVMTACSSSTPVSTSKATSATTTNATTKPSTTLAPIEIKMSFYSPQSDRNVQAIIQTWQQPIEQTSGGRVKFTNFYSEALAKAADQLKGLKAGLYSACTFVPTYAPDDTPLSMFTWQPWAPPQNAIAIYKAQIDIFNLQPMVDELAKWNAKFMFPGPGGLQLRNILTIKNVNSLAGLKGLKIRSTGDIAKSLAAVGANPITMTVPETYDAMSKGTVDAFEGAIGSMASYKLDEVGKYVYGIVTGGAPSSPIVMNLTFWNTLPPDIQKIILDAANSYTQRIQLSTQIEQDQISTFAKKGIQFIPCSNQDQDTFTKTAQTPLVQAWIKSLQDKGLPAQDIFQNYQNLIAKYSN